eukprot:scaffold12085_cov19-Tisochrysis_lutea.AAC.3
MGQSTGTQLQHTLHIANKASHHSFMHRGMVNLTSASAARNRKSTKLEAYEPALKSRPKHCVR